MSPSDKFRVQHEPTLLGDVLIQVMAERDALRTRVDALEAAAEQARAALESAENAALDEDVPTADALADAINAISNVRAALTAALTPATPLPEAHPEVLL